MRRIANLIQLKKLARLAPLLVLASCGTQSNPLGSYEDIVHQQTVPIDQLQRSPLQKMTLADTMVLCVDDDCQPGSLFFPEGKLTSHKITVRWLLPNVVYDLVWSNKVQESTAKNAQKSTSVQQDLQRSAQDPNTWNLSWNVPLQTLAENEPYRETEIDLQVVIKPGTDPQSAAVLSRLDLSSHFHGAVVPASSEPTIGQITGLDSNINIGDNRDVTIDVVDPTSADTNPPRLSWDKGVIDNQSPLTDGSVYLRFADGNSKPESLGGNGWRFHLTVDTQDVSVPKAKIHKFNPKNGEPDGETGVSLQATFTVTSRGNLRSPTIVKQFFLIKPPPPAPSPTPVPSATPSPTPTPKPTSKSSSKTKPTPKPSPKPTRVRMKENDMKAVNRSLKSAVSASSILALLVVSCAPKDPQLGPKATTPVAASLDAKPQVNFQPKVDILFVMDNAEAMNAHQDNLSANIDRFADVFKDDNGSKALDYHIGVTSLFDRTRWVKGAADCDFDNGQLRTLKHLIPDPQNPDKQIAATLDGRNYVTNTDADVTSILKATLKLGEQPFSKCGYKYEEQFGPVRALLSDKMKAGANQGFYRDDAELAVIFVGEADDETNDMTADQMKEILMAAKGGQRARVSVVAVTTSADAADFTCPRDKDGPPVKLHELVNKMQGTYLNLCDQSYGDKLAGLAQMIRKKALMHVIPLKDTPDVQTITVTVAGKQIAPGPQGWVYDSRTKSIVINGEVESSNSDSISIDYVTIDIRNAGDSRRIQIQE